MIIPVKDQPQDILECLEALEKLNYPRERLQVLVIDDHSGAELTWLSGAYRVDVIRQETSRGAAAARNAGADNTENGILAFLRRR